MGTGPVMGALLHGFSSLHLLLIARTGQPPRLAHCIYAVLAVGKNDGFKWNDSSQRMAAITPKLMGSYFVTSGNR